MDGLQGGLTMAVVVPSDLEGQNKVFSSSQESGSSPWETTEPQ